MEIIDVIQNSDCKIKNVFQIYCPECGGVRSLEALLEFDLLRSLKSNPIVILLIFDIILFVVLKIIESKTMYSPNFNKIRIVYNVFLLCIWFVFFLVRNYFLIYQGTDWLGDFYR